MPLATVTGPVAGAEQRDEVLAREIARERRAVREAQARRVAQLGRAVLAIEADRGADGDELRDLVAAAPEVVLDLEAHVDDALGAELRGLRAHALDRERARRANGLAQRDDLAGRRLLHERLAAEERAEQIDARRAAARVGLVDARADDEPVRQEADAREREELGDRELAERGDRAASFVAPPSLGVASASFDRRWIELGARRAPPAPGIGHDRGADDEQLDHLARLERGVADVPRSSCATSAAAR